jgi:predicted phage tail protein
LVASTPAKVDEILAKKKFTAAQKVEVSSGKRAAQTITGGVVGIVIGGVLVITGIFLSATGIGACCSIPLIIFGIALPFMGLASGMSNEIGGVCPYCGTSLKMPDNSKGVKCVACKKQVIVRDLKFFKVD